MTHPVGRLMPLLLHVQSNLDADLRLETLADRVGLSPFHFQRLFRATLGETPKQYTHRLRLERAAFQLLWFDQKVLDVALDCGFRSHEVFSRAFKKHHGVTPSRYRAEGPVRAEKKPGQPEKLEPAQGASELGVSRVRRLSEMGLAFLRHIGPYQDVPAELWQELQSWARATNRVVPEGPMIGIGHDDPTVTAAENLRFDAAVRVDEPFVSEGRIAWQPFPAGWYHVTPHTGHYRTLPAAYLEVTKRLRALEDWLPLGLPVVELMHTTRVDTEHELNHTEICMPVESPPRFGRR